MVAWIGFFSRVEDVVTLGAQPFGEPSACAVVDEELHRSDTEIADSVSPEITACAYAKHARMSSGSSSG